MSNPLAVIEEEMASVEILLASAHRQLNDLANSAALASLKREREERELALRGSQFVLGCHLTAIADDPPRFDPSGEAVEIFGEVLGEYDGEYWIECDRETPGAFRAWRCE